jgi:peroxiredoxin
MKNLYILVVIAGLLKACTSPEPRYSINGKIEGSDTVTFLLQKMKGSELITIDSAVSKKGIFRMKGGAVDYPEMVSLVAKGRPARTTFYLENSPITITGSLDSLFNARISGSVSHDEYVSYVEEMKPLSEKYSAAYLEFQAANVSGDTAKTALIEKQFTDIQEEMKAMQKEFVRNNPKSFVAPSILRALIYYLEPAEIESMLNAMDTAVARIPVVQEMKARVAVMKSVDVGQKAPDFTLNDVNGNPVALSSKTGTKLLLLDFWAAWCGPCRQENPNLVRVYKEFNKKGFDIFAVSLDRSNEEWVKAIADDQLTWTHVLNTRNDKNSPANMYAVYTIPSNFLIDEKGIIIGRNLRGDALYTKVKEVLGIK